MDYGLVAAAEEALAADSPFVAYLNLGVIVVVLILFYTGKLRTERECKEKDEEISILKEQIEKYVSHYASEIIPALIEQTRIGGDLVEVLKDFQN